MGNEMYSIMVGIESKTIFFYSNVKDDIKNIFTNNKLDINPYFVFINNGQENVIYKSFSFSSREYYKKGGLSIDNYPKMIWKISTETKNILGFKCQKANTSFRGRDYTVWFTTEIPGNYFPWKFEGLPGVILSFSDKEKLFASEAISVIQNKNPSVEFEEKIDKYFSTYKNSAIKYQKDIENEDKWLLERRSERNASSPLGTNIIKSPVRELDFEKEFEWEKESKKP